MSTYKIDVLDAGFVRLVDRMGSDLSIVRAARVSYNADWRSGDAVDKDEKLIHYLIKNKHTSPFESVVFTFEICCPIFVARQWHRHRTWSYNEVSARYSELPNMMYVPEVNKITTQSASNKQMRTEEVHKSAVEIRSMIKHCNEEAYKVYAELIELGTPRELARSVLPLAIYTRFFGTVSLHNLFHFLHLRLHQHAQYEIRVYAEAILDLIKAEVPISVRAWKECNGIS